MHILVRLRDLPARQNYHVRLLQFVTGISITVSHVIGVRRLIVLCIRNLLNSSMFYRLR